jgi:hypothetical protein
MRYADSCCHYTESSDPTTGEGTYTFIGPCVVTGKEQRVTVKSLDLFKYRQGSFVQDAFPYLTKEDREFLISGFSGEGWTLTFGTGEEEEDEDEDDTLMGHS